MKERSIGIFDSGIGGLTVMREVINILPHENIVYFGDTARVPYGSKSDDVVTRYGIEDARLLTSYGVKVIVVACNTVSSVAIDNISEEFDIPIIGVILPGADEAIRKTRNNRIGIIGTRATIASNAYEKTIHYMRDDIQTFSVPCPLFVPIAEEGYEDHEIADIMANEYLGNLKEENIDTLILGCTHYPLLKRAINNVIGSDVQLVDSGESTAVAVRNLLEKQGINTDNIERGEYTFLVSDIPHKFKERAERFLGMPTKNVIKVNVV